MNEAEYLIRNYGDRRGCFPILTFINVKLIFNSARLGLFSSANILLIADVAVAMFVAFISPSSYSWNE